MTLTSWMDRITKDPVKSEIYGGELIARLLDLPIDMFTGIIGGKLTKALLGLLFTWYGGKAGGGITRKGRELYELASHLLLSVLDPKPEDILRIREEFEQIKRSVGLGSIADTISVLFRDPREIKLAFELPVGGTTTTAKPQPTPQPAPAPQTIKKTRYAYPILLDEKTRGEI